jgi:excisionase family DNA binding protein
MGPDEPYGQGTRMLTLVQLCEWLNITERHARKLVHRGAIPYRKVGGLLRFPEAEVEEWTRPGPRDRPGGPVPDAADLPGTSVSAMGRLRCALPLPKSLIEGEDEHDTRRSA